MGVIAGLSADAFNRFAQRVERYIARAPLSPLRGDVVGRVDHHLGVLAYHQDPARPRSHLRAVSAHGQSQDLLGDPVDLPRPWKSTSHKVKLVLDNPRLLLVDGPPACPLRRFADMPGYYCGKNHTTGVTLQVASDVNGDVLAVSAPIPGARHDSTAFAARTSRLGDLTADPAPCVADTAYASAGLTTPITEYEHTPLPPEQRPYHRAINAQHPAAERAIATVTAWKTLTTRYRRALHTTNDTNHTAASLIPYKRFTE